MDEELLKLLAVAPSYNVSGLARVALKGVDSLGALMDALSEELELNVHEILKVGQTYLFLTVTFFYVGKVESVNLTAVKLSSASWIADTGRFAECLKEGKPAEYERIPGDGNVYITLSTVVAACDWTANLPK